MYEEITLSMTKEEALVLFEWIAREDKAERLFYSYSSEQKVIWRLEAKLEKLLPVFSPTYDQELSQARELLDQSY